MATLSAGAAAAPIPPRLLPISDVVSILASSASTHFDRHPMMAGVVRTKGRPFGTIADIPTTVG